MTASVTDPLALPKDDIERDRFGRPMVIPPEGGPAVAYTRCTTYVGNLEDTYNLSKWQQRMVALGLAESPDLVLSVAAHREDKKALDRLCSEASERARAHAAATTGTALHALTEQIDRGQVLGTVPLDYMADLAAYTTATDELDAVLIEKFCVQDHLKIGGTPDRVVRYKGKRYIFDLKTGTIDYAPLKIAAQLAVYARSKTYDIATGERGIHGAELDRGIVAHMPAGSGTCTLHWVDLLAGWSAVMVSRDVRAQRAISAKKLLSDFIDPAPATSVQEQLTLQGVPRIPLTLAEQIRACADAETVRGLWAANVERWTDDLTLLAKQHINSLGGAA